MTASQHMLKANGLRFRALVEGPAQGDLVVMLHGFPDGSESWSAQIEALAQSGKLAVAYDLRGYGLSDAPDGVDNYTIDHLVDDVVGVIGTFGRSRAHIVGHDWGALVAWCLAGKRPDLVATLTALSVGHPRALAAAIAQDPDQQARSRYIALFLQEGKAERVLADDGFRRFRAMFELGPNPGAVPRAIVDHYVRSMERPGRLTAALDYYRANLKSGAQPWAAYTRQLEVPMPTTLIWGDGDPALGRRSAESTGAYVKGAYRLEVLEGAGHWLQHERPAELSRSLIVATSH